MRFVVSLLLATVVVLAMLVAGANFYTTFFEEGGEERPVTPVELLTAFERRDLAEALGEPVGRQLPRMPSLEDIPPVVLPERTVSGFVQLRVSVGADGEVRDVEVLDATPSGVYEEAAKREVLGRRYAPVVEDGRPVPSERIEVVDFRVPPPADGGGP